MLRNLLQTINEVGSHKGSACKFCTKQLYSFDGSPINGIGGIFEEPHEGAYLGQCKICSRYYLGYWVEYRDEIFDYYCPISNEEFHRLEAKRKSGSYEESELRELIKNNEVFFKSPYEAKWVSGSSVLLQGRPW